MIMTSLTHAFCQTNGIKMHYVTAGNGPLVLLLHGFPQDWYAWRHQISALAAHFKVVAPDLRGYGETEKPAQVEDYRIDTLAKDIVGLIQELGYTKAHIVGHDWGGAIAWKLALSYPEVVDRLVVLNSPHPKIFRQALRHNFQQMRKSWYIFLFQLPYVPEWMLGSNPKKLLKGLLRSSAIRKEAFTDEDIQHYVDGFTKPGTVTAALNYYRAALRNPSSSPERKIAAPTLVIWGEDDKALSKELTYDMEPLFSGSFAIKYIPNCSHWVQEEQPELVTALLLEFLR
jgi:pimeloyl-ACP methyl ester carboxylesterase